LFYLLFVYRLNTAAVLMYCRAIGCPRVIWYWNTTSSIPATNCRRL